MIKRRQRRANHAGRVTLTDSCYVIAEPGTYSEFRRVELRTSKAAVK